MSEQNQEAQAPQADAPAAAEPAAKAPTKPRAPAPERPKPAVAAAQVVPQVAPAPKIRSRHDVSFRHDAFISDNKECFRNISYEHLKPNLVRVDHKHIFHSHSNNGRVLSRTGSACGHWHNVEPYIDPVSGELKAKCGPAMHEVTILTQTGRTVTRIEPVSFEEEILVGENAGGTRRIVDDHTHELNYIGSEELSPQGIQKALKEQQAEAAAMGIVLGANSIKDNTPAPMTPSDGATIV